MHHTGMYRMSANPWFARLQASGLHLGISMVIALLAALLVFVLWYPHPYRETSGGRALFLIVVAVDVILGPLITLAVFNLRKPRSELVRDLAVVGLIQLAALGYGLWTVFAARPVHLVFEYDRFRVVHAVDVPQEMLDRVPEEVSALPVTGPTLLALRQFRNAQEESEATLAALQGLLLSARPDLWLPYAQARERVLQAARPMADLHQRFADQAELIEARVAATGQAEDTLVYLPMVARESFWTVLLDARTAEVRGFVPLDSF